MKALLLNTIRGFFLSTMVWSMACSDVKFSPEPEMAKLQIPFDEQEETFAFNDNNPNNKVDILLVDDNSGSMLPKQEKLGAKLGPFINGLGNVDWQMAITTTDNSNGRFGIKGSFVDMVGAGSKILTNAIPGFDVVFKATVVRETDMKHCNPNVVGDCPTGDEQPLLSVINTVAKRGADTGSLFRENSDFVVIFLSDEDESYSLNPVQPQTVVDTVHTAFPNKRFTAYGIITRPGDADCLAAVSPSGGRYSHYMADLISMTGGVAGSICDADYSSSLTAIGTRVRQNSGSITLKWAPIPDKVTLVVTPFDPDLRHTIEGRSIKFNKQPKKGTRIVVRYMPQH